LAGFPEAVPGVDALDFSLAYAMFRATKSKPDFFRWPVRSFQTESFERYSVVYIEGDLLAGVGAHERAAERRLRSGKAN
jgi:hypothetical protein